VTGTDAVSPAVVTAGSAVCGLVANETTPSADAGDAEVAISSAAEASKIVVKIQVVWLDDRHMGANPIGLSGGRTAGAVSRAGSLDKFYVAITPKINQ
jgi:hypothetical protein